MTRCHFCRKPTPHLELVDVPVEIAGEPCEDAPCCLPCKVKRDERIAYDEYLSDPFNADYERARAQGWSD